MDKYILVESGNRDIVEVVEGAKLKILSIHRAWFFDINSEPPGFVELTSKVKGTSKTDISEIVKIIGVGKTPFVIAMVVKENVVWGEGIFNVGTEQVLKIENLKPMKDKEKIAKLDKLFPQWLSSYEGFLEESKKKIL